MSLGIPSTFTFKAVRNSELCRDCATALDVGTICLFFHGKMWGKGCRNVGFRVEKNMFLSCPLCVFFAPSCFSSQAMWHQRPRRDVKRWVPWAPSCGSQSMRRQTVAPGASRRGWGGSGPPLGKSLVCFFGCLWNSIHMWGWLKLSESRRVGVVHFFCRCVMP